MKSPTHLAYKLARQWENANLREARLLNEPDAWPIKMAIGKPAPAAIRDRTADVREHVHTWRSVETGKIVWKESNYRATSEAVRYPDQWIIRNTDEWIRACTNKSVSKEYQSLTQYLAIADRDFHSLLIRRRALWLDREPSDVEQTLRLCLQLHPGFADSLPLRSLPIIGNDTKFFERNERFILALLDLRFDGEATRQGLEPFLGAYSERGHWLLVIDLDGNLLPFAQLRIRASELSQQSLPGKRLLIIENETCQHQIPHISDTIAVLGTGFDLAWTGADWLREKHVGYWGDIDTWGLDLLARTRKNLPEITPLLMTAKIFDAFQRQAVVERTPADPVPPATLTEEEMEFYLYLRRLPEGRLEQEFISKQFVENALEKWSSSRKI